MKCTIDPGQCVDSLRSKYVCFVLLACCLDGLPKMQQSLPKFRKRKQKSTLQATEVVISKSSLCSFFEREFAQQEQSIQNLEGGSDLLIQSSLHGAEAATLSVPSRSLVITL